MTIESQSWREHLPEGWHDLFDALVMDIEAIDGHAQIIDAKQKFGSLRVHLKAPTAETLALIDDASRTSSKTCEICGAGGLRMIHPHGYVQALCLRHQGDAQPADPKNLPVSFRLSPDGTVEEIDRS
jgi:hypothetical protein